MSKYILYIVIAWMTAHWIIYSGELAAEPQAKQDGALGSAAVTADPFGGEDPFSVLTDTQGAPQSVGEAPRKTGRMPQAQAAAFGKEFLADINSDSRINPGNRIRELKESIGVLETRMTLWDQLDEKQTWRWLFKGFASTSSYREADGSLRSDARIDELFTDWKEQEWFASLGKRRVNWGHARGFNPVNVVAPPRDPLNPGYETEGQPMIWLSRSGLGTMDVVLTRNYDIDWSSDQNRYGIKWGVPGGESDYAVYYFDGARYKDGRAFERMLGASFSANVMPGLTLYMEAASFSRDYRNYYDAAGVVQRKGGPAFKGVVGSSIDLGGKSGVFIEYYRSDRGYTADERQNYFQAADARLAIVNDKVLLDDFVALSMDRNYLLASYTKEYREKYTLILSLLMAEDRSSSARIGGSYAPSDYYEVRSSYVRNAGNRNSEFGNNPFAGLLEIGLNASF